MDAFGYRICSLCTLVLIVIVSMVTIAHSESFSATVNVQRLLWSQEELLGYLDDYIRAEENRLQELRSISSILREKYNWSDPREESDLELGEHPIDAYHIIKYWNRIRTNMDDDYNPRRFHRDTKSSVHFEVPDGTDYNGASASVLRLQRTYNLKVEDLAHGKIYDEISRDRLRYDDYQKFGDLSLELSNYDLAAEWYNKALIEAETIGLNRADAYIGLAETYEKIFDFVTAGAYAKDAISSSPNDDLIMDKASKIIELTKILKSDHKPNPESIMHWKRRVPEWRTNYELLCRGESMPEAPVKQDLICKYKQGKIPFIRYRQEIHNYDPKIMLFLDVISDKEIEVIKNLVMPILGRAKVTESSGLEESQERVAKLAWIWDKHNETIDRITARIEDMTGLSTTFRNSYASAEPLQVQNYGIGGQYDPHLDYFEDRSRLTYLPAYLVGTGDRLATFMFYLSDIKAGGSTAFTKLNVNVPPTKHAAAFWYNFRRSGVPDSRTQHGGCPVLLGQKWVANKWFREFGQEFHRPCGLTPNAQDPK